MYPPAPLPTSVLLAEELALISNATVPPEDLKAANGDEIELTGLTLITSVPSNVDSGVTVKTPVVAARGP
jgi:hypothetical protein